MELTAKLIQLLTFQTGTGKNGVWKKQDIIVETNDQYSKKICISLWGDKINSNQLQIGSQLKIEFDIESREYNGKWYTDIKASKIEVEKINKEINPNIPNDNNPELSKSEDEIFPF